MLNSQSTKFIVPEMQKEGESSLWILTYNEISNFFKNNFLLIVAVTLAFAHYRDGSFF